MTLDILPVGIWHNGADVNATKVEARCVYDDLDTSAIYYFELRTTEGMVLSLGNLTMGGTDYSSRTDNESVLTWILSQLSLTKV